MTQCFSNLTRIMQTHYSLRMQITVLTCASHTGAAGRTPAELVSCPDLESLQKYNTVYHHFELDADVMCERGPTRLPTPYSSQHLAFQLAKLEELMMRPF